MFTYDKEIELDRELISRLANWHLGKKDYPFQLDAELHQRCNLKCTFCPRYPMHDKLNRTSPLREMTTEKWIDIVKQAGKMHVRIFNIEGANEPTAVPSLLFPVMEVVKEVGMYGILTTNGTLWDEEKIKLIVEIEWDRIHFSIDSIYPEVHDMLRGVKGSWKKAIQAIKWLNKWKEKLESKRPMLNMNICINKFNFRQLPEMVELAHKLKVDYIFTEPLMIFSEDGKKLKLNRQETNELQRYVAKAKKLAEKYGIDNNFATRDKNLEKDVVKSTGKMHGLLKREVEKYDKGVVASPCFKPFERIAIRHQGLTGPCGLVKHGENVKEKSLKEIWFGKYFEAYRKRMLNKNLFDHCKRCVPSDFTQRRRIREDLIAYLKEWKN